jgi:hypothetical protein
MSEHSDDIQHVSRCPDCQARAAMDGLDVNLDRVWSTVAVEVWATPVGTVERIAERLLQSSGLARALVATRSLVLSWIIASVVVLAAGVIATQSTGTPWVGLLAPALAGIGVAYAYGPGIDPAFELSQSMAISDRMVLLVRFLAVFGMNAFLGAIASIVSSEAAGLTLYWLAPMTAVAAIALAAATLSHSANVGVAIAIASWAVAMLLSAVDTGDLGAAVERGALIPGYVVIAVACIGLALWATSGRRDEGFSWRSI